MTEKQEPTPEGRKGDSETLKPMTDEQIARARPEEIEKQIAIHAAEAKRIDAGDPGLGLPRSEAEKARAAQAAAVAAEDAEIERLRAGLEARAPELAAKQHLREQIKSSGIHAVARNARRSPEEIEMAKQVQEKARLDAARKKLQARRKKALAPPPDPRAASIAAAVLSDASLLDNMRRRMREAEQITEFGRRETVVSSDPVLELEDAGVVLIVMQLLQEGPEILIRDWGAGGRWPEDSDLPPVPRLSNRLAHLAANGYLSIRSDGSGGCSISYGSRAREIAERWGITIATPDTAKEKVPATA
jgi:hypothetical protein